MAQSTRRGQMNLSRRCLRAVWASAPTSRPPFSTRPPAPCWSLMRSSLSPPTRPRCGARAGRKRGQAAAPAAGRTPRAATISNSNKEHRQTAGKEDSAAGAPRPSQRTCPHYCLLHLQLVPTENLLEAAARNFFIDVLAGDLAAQPVDGVPLQPKELTPAARKLGWQRMALQILYIVPSDLRDPRK